MKQPTTSLDPSLQQSEAILLTSCEFPGILSNLILSLFIYQALLLVCVFLLISLHSAAKSQFVQLGVELNLKTPMVRFKSLFFFWSLDFAYFS